jgi:hypothetical protein
MNSNYACRSSYNIDFLNKSNRSKYYFVGRNNTKEKNIRCPVCQNECFYSYTHHVVTYSNSGNVGKTKAAIKVAVKSALVPKVGRLLKGLSCSHCSNVLNFRNYNSIRKVKNSNSNKNKNKNSNRNRV